MPAPPRGGGPALGITGRRPCVGPGRVEPSEDDRRRLRGALGLAFWLALSIGAAIALLSLGARAQSGYYSIEQVGAGKSGLPGASVSPTLDVALPLVPDEYGTAKLVMRWPAPSPGGPVQLYLQARYATGAASNVLSVEF